MIETLSNRLAVKLKGINPEETASVEVMSYALQGILHNMITLLTALIAGFFTDHFWETLLAAIYFTVLRTISGGFHFKSALSCFFVTATIFIAIPLIEVTDQVLLVINVLSLILVAIYAPSNIKEHIRVDERYFPIFKLLSVLVVAANFFFLSDISTLAFFIQAFLLLNFKRR
jgi:Membrane protein putatively involved in post-translational modification of the autoinducing quorum-sensing peptide